MSVKRKLSLKSLGEKCQAYLKDSGNGLTNEKLLKNMVHLKIPFQRGIKTNRRVLLHWNNLQVKGKS